MKEIGTITQFIQLVGGHVEIPRSLALTTDESKYLTSFLNGQKLFELSDHDAMIHIFQSISDASTNTGYKTIETEKEAQTRLLYDYLLKELPKITVDDMCEAMRQGSLGKLGEFIGLSLKTYVGWIEKYIYNACRTDAIKKYMKLKEDELTRIEHVPTEAEKEKIYMEAYEADLQRVKDDEHVTPSDILFRFLFKQGIIKLSKEDSEAHTKEVESFLLSQKMSAIDPHHAGYIESILGDRSKGGLFSQECQKQYYIKYLNSKL